METIRELLPFVAANQQESVCRVEVIGLPDGRKAVICEELDDNPGQSVSNAWETVVAKVCANITSMQHQPCGLNTIQNRLTQRAGVSSAGSW